MSISKRQAMGFAAVICGILATYTIWPTQTAWILVSQTSNQSSNTTISAALAQDGWGAFDTEPHFQSGTTINVNMTYTGTASGGQLPEVCILTAQSIKHFDSSKGIVQQAYDCSQAHQFNQTTNQYTTTFQENLTETDNYLFVWRVTSSAGITYFFNSIKPTLTVSKLGSTGYLHSIIPDSQSQIFSLITSVLAVVLGASWKKSG